SGSDRRSPRGFRWSKRKAKHRHTENREHRVRQPRWRRSEADPPDVSVEAGPEPIGQQIAEGQQREEEGENPCAHAPLKTPDRCRLTSQNCSPEPAKN